MSERPSMFGQLPNDGDILTTSEYLQTAETLRVQELINGTMRVAESPSPRHQDPGKAGAGGYGATSL